MTRQYPDILGEFADGSRRFEADGIQYQAYMNPNPAKPGQATTLYLVMQSTVDVPVRFAVALDLPKVSKDVQGFKVAEQRMQLTLAPGDVVELRIPVHPMDSPPGEYTFRLTVYGIIEQRAGRLRPPRSEGRMTQTPIRDLVGLELASSIGIAYYSSTEKRPTVDLTVTDVAEPIESDLSPVLTGLWGGEDLDLQVRANEEFNDRRLHIVPPLTRPVVFTAMLNESHQRLVDSGIQPALGETIALSKILTHTVEVFLSNEELQDGLFVPIFQRLLASDAPFDNPISLLMKWGYERVTNLAIALSFGLLEDYHGGPVWTVEEQRALRTFVVAQLNNRETLPIDLLYLPLIMGGILVNNHVVFEGEDARETLIALEESRDARLFELREGDEQALNMLNDLLSR